jgi:hypothetical protein
MSDDARPEAVMVMPVKGKYSEVVFGDRVYKIWKVHPNTPEKLGTPLPYDVAVYFLGKVPPILTLVPVIKKGEHVSPLLEADIQKIKDSQERGFVGGIANYNLSAGIKKPEDSGDSGAALNQALALLAKQTENNLALQEALERNSNALRAVEEKVRVLEAGVVPEGNTEIPEGSTAQV